MEMNIRNSALSTLTVYMEMNIRNSALSTLTVYMEMNIRNSALSTLTVYLRENTYAFPTLTRPSCWHFLGCCLSKIFQSLHGDDH